VLAAVFGVVTALMNICFYESIALLPLGTAVAIEFLGPIAVVAITSRSARGVMSLLAAGAGVVLIADVQLAGEPLGVAFALLAAAFWAGYVVLGKVVADNSDSLSSLAVGWIIAAVVTSPLMITVARQDIGSEFLTRVGPMVLALAVLSSLIPYVLDQRVLRMVGRGRFALLLALLPVTAVGAGFLMLAQIPSAVELIGIALVIVALTISARPVRTAPHRPAGQRDGGPA
jgi:inner membrane transporter RhtA